MKFFSTARAVSQRPAVQQDQRVLARWLAQVNQDLSSVQLDRLASTPEFGVLCLRMRQLGEQLRQEAYAVLARGRHLDPRTAPPTSRTALVTAAARDVLGMDLLSEPMPEVAMPDNVLFAGSRPPFAWIQTFDRDRTSMRVPRPLLHVANMREELRAFMFWDMACVLGRYLHDQSLYLGGLGDFILPPDHAGDKSLTPPVHAFARAFLGYGYECPAPLGCSCLAVQFELSRVPDGLLPDATQPMATGALRHEMLRQSGRPYQPPYQPPSPLPRGATPPNGLRWQEWREEQEKQTQRELRGLTPPPESDER